MAARADYLSFSADKATFRLTFAIFQNYKLILSKEVNT